MIICKFAYVLCTWAVFEAYGPVDAKTLSQIPSLCAAVAESDRNGEVVSVRIGPLVLHSGDFGPEIFLRGDGRIFGTLTHRDPAIAENCVKLLTRVLAP